MIYINFDGLTLCSTCLSLRSVCCFSLVFFIVLFYVLRVFLKVEQKEDKQKILTLFFWGGVGLLAFLWPKPCEHNWAKTL